ncbi:MAG: DUF58 domain-containing protein [Deltaproteobacteria bacterium]|nr:DUF58 domain-containing protein [Deltaproteobacteria bacterium]
MRRLFDRVRRYGRTAREIFPLTVLGALAVGGSLFALLRYGVGRIDLVLLVVGAVGLSLGALAVLVVTLAALILWAKLRKMPAGEPLHVECGFAVSTGFALPRLWYLPFIRVSWTWLDPAATVRPKRVRSRAQEEIVPTRRGLSDAIVRRVEVGDAFGLAAIAFRATQERAVRFVPSVGALRQMHVVRSIAGGEDLSHPDGPPEGERIDMRHYVPGDPIKYVLWKVFAKSRQLIVRTPERAISPVRQTVAYLVAGEADEPAAGAARVAVEGGALGREWVLGTDGTEARAKSLPIAMEILARSSRTQPEQAGAGLASFLARATPGSVGRAVVFVPARPGPWLERVVAVARGRAGASLPGSSVEFVVCTDGIARQPRKAWLARFALRRPDTKGLGATAPAGADEVATVINALGATRSKVLLVDRLAGRVWAEGHRRALEAA